jgi:N-acetylglucosaminyl-diphospho-decaprenol L-rhamnosyltransferase
MLRPVIDLNRRMHCCARGMEPLRIERTHILVLNYNGRELLAECLPSVVAAARQSPVPCPVSVVDNGSTDGSARFLAECWADVGLIREKNLGLASFNAVLERLDEPVVLLLNNDVKLDANAVGPLVKAIEDHDDGLFSAPLCWTFDGKTYEGMRTRVRSRFGMIQGMCRVPGFERVLAQPDLTAAAGPVLAVHRQRFLELGGYDPIFFPGRIEDLDLGFRGWMAGYRGYYVPESVAYHRGFGTFGPQVGAQACDRLASRNSLIFAWKNTSGLRLMSHFGWLPIRLARALGTGRFAFVEGLIAALRRLPSVLAARRALLIGQGGWVERQEAFYRRFRW